MAPAGLAAPRPAALRAELQRTHKATAAVQAIVASARSAPPPRERRAQLARAFSALGPDALLALVALASPGAPELAGVAPKTRQLLVVGAVEAMAQLRNRRAAPLLRQLFSNEGDPAISTAAAEALGRLGSDEELQLLGAALPLGGSRSRAALLGLGQLRRLASAELLAARLRARPVESEARTLALAMGRQGSTWAWEALGPSRAEEGRTVRAALAAAIAETRERYGPALAPAFNQALGMLELR